MTPLQTLAELNLPTLAGTVPGWCSPEAGWALYRMAMAAPEGTAVVEIGSWMGRSAVWLGWGAKHGACGVRVVTIDPHRIARPGVPDKDLGKVPWGAVMGKDGLPRAAITANNDNPHRSQSTVDKLVVNLGRCDVLDAVEPVVGFSVDEAACWRASGRPPVGALYLDGDHSYAGVAGDFWAWVPLGIRPLPVMFDDTNKYGPRKLLDELEATGRWRTVGHTKSRKATWGEWDG